MSQWKATKAKRVLAALLRIGWTIKRQTGSHKILERSG
jgi:predicted RNA binding protein YcfA (HicA-like mRNA interferase family)